MFYDLTGNSWNEEEMKAILRVLRSGSFTCGENVELFEKQFANKLETKYAVMVNSGSSANLLAIASLFFKDRALKAGDEVIVPALGWATTYFPLQQFGMKLKFVDIEVNTLNLDVSLVEQAITSKTRLVVVTNTLGNPAALDELKQLCRKHSIYLLEDSCQSLGAELKGRKCGTFGDIGTFSTTYSNQISTMEGGVLVTEDQEVYHLAKCLRDQGLTRQLPPVSPIYTKKEDELYGKTRVLLPGYNVRPIEIVGAVAVEQLKKLDGTFEVRRQNACLFLELFQDVEHYFIQTENGKSSWFQFSLLVNPEFQIDRKKILKALSDADIAFAPISGGNFLNQDALKYCQYEVFGQPKIASLVHELGFVVGNYPQDLTRQLERLHKVLTAAAANVPKTSKAA